MPNNKSSVSKNKKEEAKGRCRDLFNLLELRSVDFKLDCEIFVTISKCFEEYIDLSMKDKKHVDIAYNFDKYIEAYLGLWHQYLYLHDGICSFKYQVDSSSQPTMRDNAKYELGNNLKVIIDKDCSSYLTDVSIEGIYNLSAVLGIEDDSFQILLDQARDILSEKGMIIKKSVEHIANKMNKTKITKHHQSLLDVVKNKDGQMNIKFNYKYCFWKGNNITTLTTTNYDSYNIIQLRLKTLNDRILPRLLGREHNKANARKSEPCEPDLN
jgi:hypothetical protein